MLYITRANDHDTDYDVVEVGETPDFHLDDITIDDTVMIAKCSNCGNLYAWTEETNFDYDNLKCPFCETLYMQPYYDELDELAARDWYDDFDDDWYDELDDDLEEPDDD